MSSVTIAPVRGALVDRLVRRSLVADVVLVLGGAAFAALMAQLVVPMWPVPITGQTLAALLLGASLGWVRGMSSLVVYVLVGILGAPISPANTLGEHPVGAAWLMTPSFGYEIGMILAAGLVGWLAGRRWDRHVLKAVLAFLAGEVVIYAIGLPWLAVVLGGLGLPNDPAAVLAAGFTPFLVGDLVKAAIAGALLPAAWLLVKRVKKG